MSELQTRFIDDTYVEYYNTGKHELAQIHLKSEADKVIADLEESHKKEVKQLLILNREQANAANRLRDNMEQTIRHYKYKHCLDMTYKCAVLCKKYGIKISKNTVFTHYEFGIKHPNTSSAGKIDITYMHPFPAENKMTCGDFIRNKVKWYFNQ